MRLAISYRLALSAIIISMLGLWSLSVTPSALAWGRPIDLNLSGVSCPENPNCKIYRPDMVAESNHVHLIYMNQNNNGVYYHRGTTNSDGSVTWERGRLLATNGGPSNDGIAIAADNTGTVHIAYSNNKQIYYIKNTTQGSGSWTSPELASSSGGNRIIQVAMALDANRVPYISWGQGIDPAYIAYAYRQSGGNWKSDTLSSSRQFLHRNLRMAVTGADATVKVHIFAETERKEFGEFSISYARGTPGSTFTVSNWSYAFQNSDDSDNFPSVTVDPVTNDIYAGYVDGSLRRGFRWTLSRSTDNGATWAEPFDVAPFGTSGFWGDYTPMIANNGTVYMMIQVKQMDGSDVSKWGFADVRYIQAENRLTSPQAILNYADSNRKVDRVIAYAITTNAKVGVWIRNYIEGPGYNSDPGGIDEKVRPNATVAINNGEANTKNPTINVSLSGVIGEPTSMRVSVDTPVTSATPWEPYQANFTRTVSNLNQCIHTVYVQLANDAKGLSSDSVSDDIIVDAQVQADVQVRNPYKRGNAVVFSELQQTSPLVNDGDAEYTRVANFYVEVNGAAECSQLSAVRVGRAVGQFPLEYNAKANFFANILPIPGQLVVGSNNVVLQVEDTVGNTQVFTREIKYDPTPPTLARSGTLTVTVPITGQNILTGLSFTGNQVQDNMYPGRGFWGVLVANSRTAVTNPISDTTLVWQPVQASGTGTDFTLSNWSLLSGIPAAQQTAGDYYVYVRFIDGAGNATEGYISSKVNLQQIRKPQTSLPYVTHP